MTTTTYAIRTTKGHLVPEQGSDPINPRPACYRTIAQAQRVIDATPRFTDATIEATNDYGQSTRPLEG